jgi:hypothetical protein
MANKLIVTNKTALGAKYGAQGVVQIQAALTAMVASDYQRSIITTVVYLDDVAQMVRLKAPPVTDATSDPQNKAAIDAVWSALNPVYLLILDGPDVVTQQTLKNPAEPGKSIPSDLPYASDSPYKDEVNGFVSPTRIVSRLPGVTRLDTTRPADPIPLVRAIMNAVQTRPQTAAVYENYFSAAMQISGTSQMVVSTVFSNTRNFFTSPPDGPEWSTAQYQCMSHYFGVHGNDKDPNWYGESPTKQYPAALQSRLVAQQTSMGMICTSLACFGAQLYQADPAAVLPLCNQYLMNGALAFFGSTVSSWSGSRQGPPAYGDLFCQMFMQAMLKGGSVGAMLLAARTRYAAGVSGWGPTELTTMAEFLCYGDPSFPVIAKPIADVSTDVDFHDAETIHAARVLAVGGGEVPMVVPDPARQPGGAALAVIQRHAATSGWGAYTVTSYALQRPNNPGADLAAQGLADAVHIATARVSPTSAPVEALESIEVYESAGRVVDVRFAYSS